MTEFTPHAGGPNGEAAGPDAEGVRAGAGGLGEEGHQGPVVRDRRRLDPQTGRVRQAYAEAAVPDQPDRPAAAAGTESGPGTAEQVSSELAEAKAVAEELLADLQRLNAEYVNYRKRVERDRDVAREGAVATMLEALLPVLDEVHLARQHGDLEVGPFASISEKLETILGKFGLSRYGEVGEPFDPTVHEALMHSQVELAEGTSVTTVVQVLQPGYRAGERVLRAARVAVADPVG
jgi:molecular chaperone GrpE